MRILYVESVDQVTPYKGKRQFLQTLRVIGRVRVPENTWTERIDALKVIEKRTMRKYQSLALSHYNLALWTERRSSFLNAMICIESLYNDSPIELRYRMAHRMANLLGRTAKLRRRIFKEFSDLYAVRNALIHGQKPVEVSDEDRELLLVYSRYSLITFLRLNQNKGHVLKEIDHAIYHKGNREEIQRKIGDILEVLEQKLEGMHASSS